MATQKLVQECLQQFIPPQIETTQKSITDEQINKMWYIYPYNRILLGHKKEQSTDICYNMDEHWKHYSE